MNSLTNTSESTSMFSIIICVVLLVLAIKFPILFLIQGLFSLSFGIYMLVEVNSSISKMNEVEKTGTLSNLLYGYPRILSWIMIIMGAVSLVIFFIMQFMNLNKGANSSVTNFSRSNIIKRNYINTNRYVKN
jgi:hypothetical protein